MAYAIANHGCKDTSLHQVVADISGKDNDAELYKWTTTKKEERSSCLKVGRILNSPYCNFRHQQMELVSSQTPSWTLSGGHAFNILADSPIFLSVWLLITPNISFRFNYGISYYQTMLWFLHVIFAWKISRSIQHHKSLLQLKRPSSYRRSLYFGCKGNKVTIL